MFSSDGVALSQMVSVSASVNLPLHHKVQKFSSGTGSAGWYWKKGHKTVVVWCFQVTLNHATRYASQHIWCLSQARIKWEGCGRKGIRRKPGRDDGGGSLISADGVAPSWMVSVSASYLPLHDKVQKKISSGTGSPRSPRKRAVKQLCVCVSR